MKISRSYFLQLACLPLGAIALLSLAGCSASDSMLPEANEQTILQIGQLSIGNESSTVPETRATDQWSWANGDQISATAGSYFATYTYDNSVWTTTSIDFTKEHVDTTPITLKYGAETPETNQSTEANYRLSDFIESTSATLEHITINATLEHQQTDVVIKIAQGDGWASTNQFNTAMAEASLKLQNKSSIITPYRPSAGTEYRCILTPATVVGQLGSNNVLATFTFGSGSGTPVNLQGLTAQIVVSTTQTEANLKGKRYTVTVTLSIMMDLTISANIASWKENTPGSDFPVE